MQEKKKFFSAKNIAVMGVLLAVALVLQAMAGFFPSIFKFNLTLIPIALASIVFGWTGGGFIGLMVACLILIFGVTGVDATTSFLLSYNPVVTVLTVLLKGTLSGVVSGLVFRLISKKNQNVAVIISTVLVPIVNTGVFVLGALCMFDVISALNASLVASGVSQYTDTLTALFLVFIGINFIIEFIINLILSPALYTVYRVTSKRMGNEA